MNGSVNNNDTVSATFNNERLQIHEKAKISCEIQEIA
jgi:hypothetical protein